MLCAASVLGDESDEGKIGVIVAYLEKCYAVKLSMNGVG